MCAQEIVGRITDKKDVETKFQTLPPVGFSERNSESGDEGAFWHLADVHSGSGGRCLCFALK